MATLKKYNLSGKEIGSVQIDDAFLDVQANSQMIKDYIVALRANARQWSANTRGRSEVVHTTKKPHRQKGTGSARQGSLVSPQYRGGGIVFGPKPKFDQHVRINRKERRLVIRQLLAEKIKSDALTVMEDAAFSKTLKTPHTKSIAQLLKSKEIFGRKILFVGEGSYQEVETEGVAENAKMRVSVNSTKHDVFKLSVRNVPKTLFAVASNVNGYDLVAARHIIMTESALNELKELLI